MHYFLGFFAVCLLAGGTLQGAETVTPKTKKNPKAELRQLNGDQLAVWITRRDLIKDQQRALHFAADIFHEIFAPSYSLREEADVDPEKLLEKSFSSLFETYSKEKASLQRLLIMLLSAIQTEDEPAGLTTLSLPLKNILREAIDTFSLRAWLDHFELLPQHRILMELISDGTFTPIDPDSAPDSEASKSPTETPVDCKPSPISRRHSYPL